jgi:outer membrane protein OmpA-like peptidoglycan-associated protein
VSKLLRKGIGAGILVAALGFAGASAWRETTRFDATYVVPFSRNAELAEGAEDIVSSAAASAMNGAGREVLIRGHAAPQGDPVANSELGRIRAEAVRERLVSKGVPREAIRVESRGGEAPLQRGPDETERAWLLRLSRAEVQVREAR